MLCYSLLYCHWVSPWCRLILEKVTVSQFLSNSPCYIVTFQYYYIYCHQTQQSFIAFVDNAACYSPSYGPLSGTEYIFKKQVCREVNIWNFWAHIFYNLISILTCIYMHLCFMSVFCASWWSITCSIIDKCTKGLLFSMAVNIVIL